MYFTDAIKDAVLLNLSENKKALVMGLGMSYPSEGLVERFPGQVFDMPASELAITGMAVGLASQGYRPLVVHGRIEFALLALDQILTQASRWEYMFGGGYPCPLSLRIMIGRQWGNGPQHTANYHSIFLQASGLDVLIPSTPKEAYDQIRFMSINNKPSVFFEHRWLYKVSQDFNVISKDISKIPSSTVYPGDDDSQNILIITYADGLIDALKAQELLAKNGIYVSVLNVSSFPAENRINQKMIDYINNFINVIFFDTAPIEFGLLSGLSGLITLNNKKKNFSSHYLSPPFQPCPTAPSLVKDYYKTYIDIINLVSGLLNSKLGEFPELTFDEINLWQEIDLSCLNRIKIF